MIARPLLFWGIDSYSNGTLNHFIEFLGNISEALPIHTIVSVSQEDPILDFKGSLLRFREKLKTQNISAEPRVVLFSSAFIDEPENHLAFLEKVSDILKISLPGSQSIVMTVFIPPQIAEDPKIKINAFRYFIEMEKLIWNVPFLNMIFVNQLSRQLYQDSPGTVTADDPIFKLLSKELLENDFQIHIQGIGVKAIENHGKIAGRKCCYSTSGTYQLIYYPEECRRYVEARFKKEVFDSAFMNTQALLENLKSLEAIQNRSDQFVLNQVELLSNHLPEPGRFLVKPVSHGGGVDTIQKAVSVIKEEIDKSIQEAQSYIQVQKESLAVTVCTALNDFLCGSPGYLAGAKLYMASLEGRRLCSGIENNENQPSGIKLFENRFCIGPLIHSMEGFFQPYLAQNGLLGDADPVEDSENSGASMFVSKANELIHGHSLALNPEMLPHIHFAISSMAPLLDYIMKGLSDFKYHTPNGRQAF